MSGVRVSVGPPAGRPRPLGEAPLARRAAILALAFFFAAAATLAWRGTSMTEILRAFPLFALGGFSILIFGTSRLLISGMAGRDVVGGGATAALASATAAAGAVGLFFASSTRVGSVAFALLWAIGALTHVVVIGLTLRGRSARPPVTDARLPPAPRWPLRALEGASLAYAAASAIVVPLAYAGRLPLASAAHVVLVGFVVTTIMGVASHILPRFTGAPMPRVMLSLLAPIAVASPAAMSLGLAGRRALLPIGALGEALAVALFGASVVVVLAQTRRFRPQDVAYATAPFAIGIGGGLALAFATSGLLGSQLATHAILNVFGFVGLFVLAASTDLYGPALQPGAAPAKRHAGAVLALTMLGLAVAAVGTALPLDLLARAGMAIYAVAILWQLAGVVATHRRAGRVVGRFRSA